MTPQEKARELIVLFAPHAKYTEHKENGDLWKEEITEAQKCALKCVDEILNLGYDDRLYLGSNDKEFWQGVKQEIELLK